MATVSIVECQKRALKMEAQLIALEGAFMSIGLWPKPCRARMAKQSVGNWHD
jgi:hypothetical protein